MKYLSVLSALLVCAATTVRADEASHRAAAMQLVSKIESKEAMLNAFLVATEPMTKQMAQRGVPPEAIKEVRQAITDWFNQEVNFDTMAPKLAALYMEEFSEDELKQVIAFYETPTGQKMLSKQPTLVQKTAVIGQEQLQGKQASLQQKVMEIMSKYAPSGAAAPGAPGAPSGAK